MGSFKIPICLFMFQRKDSVVKIINRISEIRPQKIYFMSDQGRNEQEIQRVIECRRAAENAVNWKCEIVKDYASENRGVFENIGLGAMRVFKKEEVAIFLEDDNLPEVTFFRYCEEMLIKYKDNDRIAWVCGTNYLGKYQNNSHESYMFTKQLLPCGWASWKHKYEKYYDCCFSNYSDIVMERIKGEYKNKALYKQQKASIDGERKRMLESVPFKSWDFQMLFSIYANDLLGISPVNNQIRNIGVDQYSEHGGVSYKDIMTKRFCGMSSFSLEFPLKDPVTVLIDPIYEKKIEKIILYPLSWRIRKPFGKIKRKLFSKVRRKND